MHSPKYRAQLRFLEAAQRSKIVIILGKRSLAHSFFLSNLFIIEDSCDAACQAAEENHVSFVIVALFAVLVSRYEELVRRDFRATTLLYYLSALGASASAHAISPAMSKRGMHLLRCLVPLPEVVRETVYATT